jgi:hypothetical protein
MFDLTGFQLGSTLGQLGLPLFEMAVAMISIVALFLADQLQETPPGWFRRLWSFRTWRWSLYLAGCYTVIFFGYFGRVDFIYFQFCLAR